MYADSRRDGQPQRAAAVAVVLASVGVLSLCVDTAAAQPAQSADAPAAQSDAAREAARSLGLEALQLYDRGEYSAALTRFEQAYSVYPAPTLGLHAARCLVRLGRLASALEAYARVTRRPLDADATDAFREAHTVAAQEQRDLEPRVPRLSVRVEGARPGEGATLAIDGKLQEGLHADVALDAGKHRVEARLGAQIERREVALLDGRREQLTLRLVARTAAPPPEQPAASGSPLRPLGLVTLGVGVAGLAVWGVAGVLAVSKRSDLEDGGCSGDSCPRALEGDVESYDTLRTVSGIGFVVGAVGVAGGVALLLAAPGERAEPRVSAWVGAGAGGVRGRF